jgi:hypothetical protein
VPVDALGDWARRNIGRIYAARGKFDGGG